MAPSGLWRSLLLYKTIQEGFIGAVGFCFVSQMPRCLDLLKPEQLLPHQPYGAINYWLPWLQIQDPSAVWLHHTGWKEVQDVLTRRIATAFEVETGLSIKDQKSSLKKQVTEASYPTFNGHYSISSIKRFQGTHVHTDLICEKFCLFKSTSNSRLPSPINKHPILHGDTTPYTLKQPQPLFSQGHGLIAVDLAVPG